MGAPWRLAHERLAANHVYQVAAPERDPLDNRQWTLHSKAARAKFRMTPKYCPWTAETGARRVLEGVPGTPRIFELLTISWGSRKRRQVPWFTDLSQCVSRQAWSEKGLCLTTSSMVYCHTQDRVLKPIDKLATLGMPVADVQIPEELSSSQLHEMCGEAMCLPSVGSILLALFLCSAAPWWSQENDRPREA